MPFAVEDVGGRKPAGSARPAGVLQRELGWNTSRGMLNAIDRRSVFKRESDLAIERRVMPVLVDQPRMTKT